MSLQALKIMRSGVLPQEVFEQAAIGNSSILQLERAFASQISTLSQLEESALQATSLEECMAMANVFCRINPGFFKLLLVEHGETLPKIWKVKQGGSTVLQRANSSDLTLAEIVRRKQEGLDKDHQLGIDPSLTSRWLETRGAQLAELFDRLEMQGQISREVPAVVSGLRRTQQTAEAAGLRLREQFIMEELSERNLGPISGLKMDQIAARFPDLYRAILEGRELEHPDIEPAERVRYRVKSAVVEVMDSFRAESGNAPEYWIPVVGHQTTLQSLICMLAPAENRPKEWDIEISLGSVSIVLIASGTGTDSHWSAAGRPYWPKQERYLSPHGVIDAHQQSTIGPEGEFNPRRPLTLLQGSALRINDMSHFR